MKRTLPFNLKIYSIFILFIALSFVAISYFALENYSDDIAQSIDRKSMTVGNSIKQILLKALDAGVPFDALRGMDRYFAEITRENEEISYLVITDSSDKVLYQIGWGHSDVDTHESPAEPGIASTSFKPNDACRDSCLPIEWQGDRLGFLHVGVLQTFIVQKHKAIIYDVLTVVVVTLLVVFELVSFLLRYSVTNTLAAYQQILKLSRSGNFNYPMHVDDGGSIGRFGDAYNAWIDKLNRAYQTLKEKIEQARSRGECPPAAQDHLSQIDARFQFGKDEQLPPANLQYFIRPALFLFVFAEAMSLSFLPMYASDLYEFPLTTFSLYAPIMELSQEIVIGLPISIFMFFWAISQPFAGIWSDRVGRRKAFIVGASLTAMGLFLSGLARCPGDLIAIRGLSGIGYGIVFITCTAYVTDYTTQENRARGMAMFLSGFFSGSLCGAAIGGILVEQIGFRMVLFLSTVLALAAILFVFLFLPKKKQDTIKPKRSLRLSDFKILFQNVRFLALVICIAIPAKICLTGIMNYTAPLYLKSIGNSPAVIGRVLMSYGLVVIFIAPLIGNLADRIGNRKRFIQVGGVLGGIALMGTFLQPGVFGVWLGVCLLGLAHSIGVSSQLAYLPELGWSQHLKKEPGTIMGIFRLIERVGSIVGPLIAGILIVGVGFPITFLSIGGLTVTGVLIFSLTLLLKKRPLSREENS